MNNPRANIANLIAAAGGALLILATFIGWFGGGDESFNAWKTFSLADIALIVIALGALALGAAGATGNAASLPDFLKPSILKWLGTVALTISLLFAIELTSGQFEADLKFGAILAVLASAAILAGGILNDRPDLAAKLNEATAGIGGGQAGPGAGPGPGTPAVGAPQGGPGATPAASAPPAAAEPAQPATAPQPAAGAAGAGAAAGGESSGPAPGWYPDPQGQKRLRYWDGSRWTEQTAD